MGMCSAASLRWLPCLVTLLDVTRCLVSPPLARVCPVCPLCAVTILPCPCPSPTLFPCPCQFPCHSQLVPLLWLLLLLASPSTSMFSMTMRTPPLSRNQLILVLPKPRIAPLFCLFPSSSWHF